MPGLIGQLMHAVPITTSTIGQAAPCAEFICDQAECLVPICSEVLGLTWQRKGYTGGAEIWGSRNLRCSDLSFEMSDSKARIIIQ